MGNAKGSSWEEWGQVDPLWAIVTQDGKEFGGWDLDEFFATGQATINSLWATASGLGLPRTHDRGLDFGCGIGRLTRALGAHVGQVTGVDISPSMVSQAEAHHAHLDNLRFAVHGEPTLAAYGDGSFDVVCSLLVLQHLPSDDAITTTLRELVRVLAAGGVLMLQLPDHLRALPASPSLRMRLRPRTRLAQALHAAGVPPRFLYRRLGWKPEMTMRAMAEEAVCSLVADAGGRVAWSSDASVDASGVRNIFYLITR